MFPEMQATTKPRTVYDTKVLINDKWYDADDMLETLHGVASDNVEVYDKYRNVFMDNKILSSMGSQRWQSAAKSGENYEGFVQALRKAIAVSVVLCLDESKALG